MAYIVGISSLARGESARSVSRYWPLAFLAAPIILALFMNAGPYREPAWLLSTVLALWIIRSLRPVLWGVNHNVERAVSHLLAGIVFVDLLAIAGAPLALNVGFLLLFGAALLGQRIVPAT
jgi:hypothetical protein